MDKTNVTKDLEAKTLTITREFDAPKAKIWRAYADKDMFVQWWGPEGWETTVKEFVFQPGGRNLYVMKCVDKNQGEFYGQESWGLMEYTVVEEPDSFTYRDSFANPDGSKQGDMPVVTIAVTLTEQDGKTTVASTVHADTAEAIEKLISLGMVEGTSSTFDRLDKTLAQ